MPIVSVQVIGLDQCKAALEKAKTSLPNSKRMILERVGSLFIREAKNRSHVITGNMKRSIALGEMEVNSGQVEIIAGANYSYYENRRGDPHNFWDQAVEVVEQSAGAIVKKGIDDLLSGSGIPVRR